jgi:hypothetical protein
MKEAKIEIFKEHPVLVLNPDDRFPIRMGASKLRAIIQHVAVVEAFLSRAEDITASNVAQIEIDINS